MAFQIPPKYSKYIACKESKHLCFVIKTYTVRPLNGRRGPDDETYKAFPELVNLVYRGFSDLFLDDKYLLTIKGMPKFDGTSSIDEDDFEELNSTEPQESGMEQKNEIFDSKTVSAWSAAGILKSYFKEKANGKFVIFRLFELDGKIWIFGGSKNMHIPVELDNPIIGRNLHEEILRTIQADLLLLSEDQLRALLGKTIVGEYVDGKHLVYVVKPFLVYFNVPAGINLPVVKDLMPAVSGLPQLQTLQEIRKMRNIEGVVIEYQNTTTGEIIRQKHKSVWYIVLRCWREMLSKRNKTKHTPHSTIAALKLRLKQRSDQFLHLSDEEITEWNATAEKFVNWIYKSKYDLANCSPFSNVGMAKILDDYYKSASGVDLDDLANLSKDFSEVTLSEKNPLDNLAFPKMFGSVIAAAQFGLSVVVAMSGPSGSGKSSVTKQLLSILQEQKISAESFSTDSYFMIDEVYSFNPAKLQENHAKNLAAFQVSKAQVRIVDNTNLARWEYANYFSSAEKAVCIVLYMKERTVNDLVARSSHGVSAATLSGMLKKFKPSAPAYYGLFPLDSDLAPIISSNALAQEQKTPLHVTAFFVGGAIAKDLAPYPELLNSVVDLEIVGYSVSEAGKSLVTKSVIPGNHITLSTNKGFKPVDVGTGIKPENTTSLANSVVIKAVYLPFY